MNQTFIGHANEHPDSPELDAFLDWLQFDDGEFFPSDVVSKDTFITKLSEFRGTHA